MSDVPGIRGNGKSKRGDLLRGKMREEVKQFCEESQEVILSLSRLGRKRKQVDDLGSGR